MSGIRRVGVPACLGAAAALFFVYTYNSGYGYDALEYLVIGRSLLDGYTFYTFIPSKSWGLYYLVAGYLSLFGPVGHEGVSILITVLLAAVLLTCYLVTRHLFGTRMAVTTTSLVALCGPFMEMNYLEPEGPVLVFGMLAYLCAAKGLKSNTNSWWALAGVSVGLGFAFKSVAGFYGLGIVLFLLWSGLTARNMAWAGWRVTGIVSGSLVTLLAQWGYFALTGRGSAYMFWTFVFPLFYYPSNTEWLYKIFTKNLWFVVVFGVALVLSLLPTRREAVWKDEKTSLAFAMGVAALLALLKTQASHYLFPAAGFLSVFIARVLVPMVEGREIAHRRRVVPAALVLVALVVVSTMLYRPSAFGRLATLRPFNDEAEMAATLKSMIPPGSLAVFLADTALYYWISDRYPNYPFVYLDAQAAHWVEEYPGTFATMLSDPNLKFVGYDATTFGAWLRNRVEPRVAARVSREVRSWLDTDFVRRGKVRGMGEVWMRR